MITRYHFASHDVALARHVAHDDLSWNYPVDASNPIVTKRWTRNIGILNQKALGSCTGNASVGTVSTQPFGRRCTEADAVSVYSQATHLDGIRGVYPPTDTGSSGLAVAKALKARGWITGYKHAFSLQGALSALMVGPGFTGITWLTGCDSPDKEGIVRYSGTVRGGHEIEVNGYDASRDLVWFTNSWGAAWGLQGCFAMSGDDYRKALSDHGDATFPDVPAAS